jgi:hypothetical protein
MSGGCSGAPTRPQRVIDHSVDQSAGGVSAAEHVIVVRDGWTEQAVAGAHVTGAGVDGTTNEAGQITLSAGPGCVMLTVRAPGYLDRQTCATSAITLWPVANEAEAAATREAVFNSGEVLRKPSDIPWLLTGEILERGGLRNVWLAAARQLRSLGFTIPMTDNGDDSYIVSVAATPPLCNHSGFTWSFVPAGFCWDTTPDYFIYNVTIDPARLQDEAVAVRAIVYRLGMRPHSAPGLMNETDPANELSEFEKRTLRMMYLRRLTYIAWPDYDVH